MELAKTLVLTIGATIFVFAFLFQAYKILLTGKHTKGLSPTAWMLNYVGRALWIIYALFLPGWQGELLLGVQGFIAVANVPIVYYTWRNRTHSGIYEKRFFEVQKFTIRVVLAFLTTLLLVTAFLIKNHVINIPFVTGGDVTDASGAVIYHREGADKALSMIFGFTTTFFTSIAFLPQAIQTFKTRNTQSTSIYLSAGFSIGNFLLIMYLTLCVVQNPDTVFVNLGGIILPFISTGSMFAITFIKLGNMIRHGEK